MQRPSGAPLHTLLKLYDVPFGCVTRPLSFEAVLCFFCDRCCSISVAHRSNIAPTYDLYIKLYFYCTKVARSGKFGSFNVRSITPFR